MIKEAIKAAGAKCLEIWNDPTEGREKLEELKAILKPAIEELDNQVVRDTLPDGFIEFVGHLVVDNPISDAVQAGFMDFMAETIYQTIKATRAAIGA
jgi:hypothetical protein